MTFKLRTADRKQSKIRLGLSGASGFGKTYSALLIAKGLVENWSKIAIIDTENMSADLYSSLGNYNVITLLPPFSPERYIKAIKECENAEMEVIIVDSISHEWDGEGGMMEIVDQKTKASRHKSSYIVWREATPLHRSFLNTMLQSKCHIITTVRRKQEFEMTKNDKGKMEVQKVGTKEVTREGFEYELTANLEFINDNHYVKASKDRTGLFMDKPEFIPSEETGKIIKEWCENGSEEKASTEVVSVLSNENFEKYKIWIAKKLKEGEFFMDLIEAIKGKYKVTEEQEKGFVELGNENFPEVKNEAIKKESIGEFFNNGIEHTLDQLMSSNTMINQKTMRELFAVWNKYAKVNKMDKKNSDGARKMALENMFKKESTTELTEKEAKKFIERFRNLVATK